MPTFRRYADGDWDAVLELSLLAFAPACESRESVRKTNWRAAVRGYVRSLTRQGERDRLIVAEMDGSVVGVVHYQVDRGTQSGSIGLSAVHPARQGQGIGSLLYGHVLDEMSAQNLTYATADTETDSSHAPARRAHEKAGFTAVPTVHYFIRLPRPASSRRRRIRPRGRRTRRVSK